MLTEAETKEIEDTARKLFSDESDDEWVVSLQRQAYIAGATAMAEKKNERIEELEAGNLNLKSWNSILKEELESTQAEVKTWEGVAASRLREIAEIQSELERVKTVADKFAVALEYPNLTTHTATSEALASWNKSKSETLNEPKR